MATSYRFSQMSIVFVVISCALFGCPAAWPSSRQPQSYADLSELSSSSFTTSSTLSLEPLRNVELCRRECDAIKTKWPNNDSEKYNPFISIRCD
ncbi:unnamed protein product [Protopolystoma xenopodis]|uniref:Uncharacterized protein n=1 Tax=Protopolystoma xenopodis TaxID=117903 RepID=A0A448X5W9_9PLAT|nr:unnamed protein product [Protopolystoma xenopodis]